VNGWIFFLIACALVFVAAALGIVEVHWNRKFKLRSSLADLLRSLSDRLDSQNDIANQNHTTQPPAAPIPVCPNGKVIVEVAPQGIPIVYRGSEAGWYNVLSAGELIECIGGTQVIGKILKAARLAPDVFNRTLLPALQNYAEFVQLMPASQSHHHANPGGLLAHTLETVLHALTFRTGYLLPKGASAEIIATERDYWTYAVFLCALLHDAGKPMVDLNIQMRRVKNAAAITWMPAAGSLRHCGATEYFVAFKRKNERDYSAHARQGAVLLQQLVPGDTLATMAQAPTVLQELNRYLGGDGNDTVLEEIVRKADQESTRRNLALGSRARFDTAEDIPLIEKLMEAMRTMLRQGGHLPLNRSGSSGWVYDDSVWFVAKRLADSVREFILKNATAGEPGIPNDSKNDRLFDAWQEYGFITPNPINGQAIWKVAVKGTNQTGEAAYRHELSVLRFPLSKIWSDPTQYPDHMMGTVESISQANLSPAVPDQPDQTCNETSPQPSVGDCQSEVTQDAAGAPAPGYDLPELPNPAAQPSDLNGNTGKVPPPRFATGKSAGEVLDNPTHSDLLDDSDSASYYGRSVRRGTKKGLEELKQDTGKVEALPSIAPDDRLDGTSERTPRASSGHASTTPSPYSAISLPKQVLPSLDARKAKEPSALAIEFIKWVQTNLSNGNMKHNETGAPVHFIAYGMALVSPLIFKLFAAANGTCQEGAATDDELAMSAQRELIRARWHSPAPGGKNVWTLYVLRKGALEPRKLSAVVLKDPHRWVTPVPPPNPYISATDPGIESRLDSDEDR